LCRQVVGGASDLFHGCDQRSLRAGVVSLFEAVRIELRRDTCTNSLKLELADLIVAHGGARVCGCLGHIGWVLRRLDRCSGNPIDEVFG
jgi:hypothetical protein